MELYIKSILHPDINVLELYRNESERDVYRRIATWLKLTNSERLKKFKRITKTEKRLNFVNQRFPPPSMELEKQRDAEIATQECKEVESISNVDSFSGIQPAGNQLMPHLFYIKVAAINDQNIYSI